MNIAFPFCVSYSHFAFFSCCSFHYLRIFMFIVFNNRFIASGLNKSPFMLIEEKKNNISCVFFVFSRQIFAFKKKKKRTLLLTIGNYNYGNFTHCRIGTMPKHSIYEWICQHETKALSVSVSLCLFSAARMDDLFYFIFDMQRIKIVRNSFRSHFSLRAIWITGTFFHRFVHSSKRKKKMIGIIEKWREIEK